MIQNKEKSILIIAIASTTSGNNIVMPAFLMNNIFEIKRKINIKSCLFLAEWNNKKKFSLSNTEQHNCITSFHYQHWQSLIFLDWSSMGSLITESVLSSSLDCVCSLSRICHTSDLMLLHNEMWGSDAGCQAHIAKLSPSPSITGLG